MIAERRTPRVAAKEQIEYHNSKIFIRAYMLNLSVGGVFIETNSPLPIDAQFAISLHIPGESEILDVQGRVVWNKKSSLSFPAGMGVQFINLSPNYTQRIQSYINACNGSCPVQNIPQHI